jgi:hypothetical protein
MLSPFPGVDPYLENPELWPEVHSRLIVAIADDLSEHLSQKYRVAIEKRIYLTNSDFSDLGASDESLLVGIPDIALTAKASETQAPTATIASVEPITVTVPIAEEVQERYLEIREVATGSVITAIEILSPKNKRAGEGRQAYERKRNRILASLTHLVEIDLLRGGQPLPIQGAAPSDYRILISRSDRRPTAQLYRFSIRQPIPQILIPLMSGESAILNLQLIFAQVYQRGRYYLAIDYTQPLKPALAPEDADWAKTLAT